MKINSKQYAIALFDLVSKNKNQDLEKVISAFAKLLTERNDHFKLAKILLEFEALWQQEHSIVKIEIESARELTQELSGRLLEKIKKIVKAEEIILLQKINKDIIGGAVIRYNDQILDLSLKTRLRKFKESLSV